jgi:hypothetical protein
MQFGERQSRRVVFLSIAHRQCFKHLIHLPLLSPAETVKVGVSIDSKFGASDAIDLVYFDRTFWLLQVVVSVCWSLSPCSEIIISEP